MKNRLTRKNNLKEMLLEKVDQENLFLVEYVSIEESNNNESITLYDQLNERTIVAGSNVGEIWNTLFNYETGYLYETYHNNNNKYSVLQVYIIHDNMYFNLDNAIRVQDGKDYITTEYIIAKPFETIVEGSQCYHARYNSFDGAYDDAKYENEKM